MTNWVVGLGLGLACYGCGSRTEPLNTESHWGGRSGTLSSEGGASSGASGIVATGGSAIAAGGMSSGGATTAPAEPTRRWFVAKEGGISSPKLYLVGVHSDDAVDVHALPPTDGFLLEGSGNGVFSSRGDKYCYVTATPSGSRIWVVTLKPSSYNTQELTLPAGTPQGNYSCWKWLSDTLVAVQRGYEPPPEPQSTWEDPDPVILSTDPAEPIPVGTIDDGTPSPDGKFSIRISSLWGQPTLELHRVRSDGMLGEGLLSVANTVEHSWSADSKRLAVVPGGTYSVSVGSPAASVFVYDLTANGVATVIDEFGPYSTYLVSTEFSPDGRFLTVVSTSENGIQVFVRDVVARVESTLVAADGTIYSGMTPLRPTWLKGNHLVLPVRTSTGTYVYSAAIDATTMMQGKTALLPLLDQGGNRVSLTGAWLTVGTNSYVLYREKNGQQVLQQFTIADSGGVLVDLLPGIAGDAIPGTITDQFRSGGDLRQSDLIVAAAPSYYYLTFDDGQLARSLRLIDYLGQYRLPYGATPKRVGLIARDMETSALSWLSLEHATPGPLLPIPLPHERLAPDTEFVFPKVWPVY